MGDAITEFCTLKDPDYFSENNYINRGISGQTSSQMVLRFQQDAIDNKPQAVIILAGTNDIAENSGAISNKNILKNIKSMVEIAQYNQINVIICSVLPAYNFAWKKGLNPALKIIDINKIIKTYAEEKNLKYVDYNSEIKDERNGLDNIKTVDGGHTKEKG